MIGVVRGGQGAGLGLPRCRPSPRRGGGRYYANSRMWRGRRAPLSYAVLWLVGGAGAWRRLASPGAARFRLRAVRVVDPPCPNHPPAPIAHTRLEGGGGVARRVELCSSPRRDLCGRPRPRIGRVAGSAVCPSVRSRPSLSLDPWTRELYPPPPSLSLSPGKAILSVRPSISGTVRLNGLKLIWACTGRRVAGGERRAD